MNLKKYKIFLLLIVFVAPSLLNADVILLRSGQRLEGKIVAQSRTIVRIKTPVSVQAIPRSTVRRIVFRPYDFAAEKKKQEALKKKRAEYIKKQQEAFKKRQEAFLKQQQAAALKKQQEETLKQLDNIDKEKEQQREAARRQAAEAEQKRLAQQNETTTADSGGSLLAALLLPGYSQFQQGRNISGSAYAGTALMGLAGAGYFASQRAALNTQYSGLEETINLLFLTGNSNSGGALDLLLTMQLGEVGAQANQAAVAGVGSAGLVLGVYIANTLDVLIARTGSNTAVRLHLYPNHTSLAYEVRF